MLNYLTIECQLCRLVAGGGFRAIQAVIHRFNNSSAGTDRSSEWRRFNNG
nr:MAG TPA: hypothetical protein [Caudoviricetes sp.]